MNSDLLQEMTVRIIREQELVIGPLAWIEAAKVAGLQVIDQRAGTVLLNNADPKVVVDRLIAQYEKLFGKASHEVSRDAVRSIIANMTANDVPTSLR